MKDLNGGMDMAIFALDSGRVLHTCTCDCVGVLQCQSYSKHKEVLHSNHSLLFLSHDMQI